MKPGEIFRFGEYQLHTLTHSLRRDEELVRLNRRAYDVLLYLVQNPGRIIPRDELLKNAWPDTFVEENSLTQSISALRRALEEKPGVNNYIATLPGRGYQFVSPVQVIASELSTVSVVPGIPGDGAAGIALQRETIRTTITTTTQEQEKAPQALLAGRRAWTTVPLVAAVLLVLALGGYLIHLRLARGLSSKDTVVVADFRNRTGDTVFDDTLKTALDVALAQSPFLNSLSHN
jgi:DNA-binding winged helix-turn-helix (wHTH) protein